MKYVTTVDDQEYIIEIVDDQHVVVDGVAYEVDFESVSGQPVHSLLVNDRSYEAYVYPSDEGWQVLLRGTLYQLHVEDERERRLRASLGAGLAEYGEFHLKSPMPGMIVAVSAEEGQKVSKGDVLVILESMKMQNELKSPRAGTISRVRVRPGDNVEQRETLLSIE
ncbi:MAG TPA: biotin/lipoyl-containing protein [Anaerolineales bacterium]|jgi:acetyl/propionyl-CoA carboxylase alpha subunit|nr:biotin/lipoyl-containing protein [Anaerolineales bacterium]